jgi:Sec-independent protein secretion pathway component TatC
LPIINYGISLTGLIDSKFWRKNFRYAAFILVIFGAIKTHDANGVIMWFVAASMILLYLIGIIAVQRRERNILTI